LKLRKDVNLRGNENLEKVAGFRMPGQDPGKKIPGILQMDVYSGFRTKNGSSLYKVKITRKNGLLRREK